MIRRLEHLLRSPELAAQLQEKAAPLATTALLSLEVDLGTSPEDGLQLFPEHRPAWYYAQMDEESITLGLGEVVRLASQGEERFAALRHGFSGLLRQWQYQPQAAPPAAFLGFSFFPESDGSLPAALLAVPAVLLRRRQGHWQATLTTLAGNASAAIHHWQSLLVTQTARPLPTVLRPPQPLPEQAWIARTRAALRAIGAGTLNKVVLARGLKLQADQALPPATLLRHLLELQHKATVFAYGDGHQVFLGASPEQLVRLRQGTLSCDALAGTAWAGSTELASDKNRHEQRLVTESITQNLAVLCTDLAVDPEPEILEAGQVSHLRTRIRGRLRADQQIFDILRCLHPTPAVGGTPTRAALDWLLEHGEKRPAWYAGGIGLIQADGDGDITVALRSGTLTQRDITLHAGAGIVAGSIPEQELAETEAKFRTLLTALEPEPLPLQAQHS